jgi:hypothetical protein
MTAASGSGRFSLSRPPLNFQIVNLLCWPERPGSAKSEHLISRVNDAIYATKRSILLEEDRLSVIGYGSGSVEFFATRFLLRLKVALMKKRFALVVSVS